MIAAPVSVFHLVSVGSGGKGHELMPQADCKNGNLGVIQLFDLRYDGGALLGVSGAVAQHNAVGGVRNDFGSGRQAD